MTSRTNGGLDSPSGGAISPGNGASPVFPEDLFLKMLCLERKRAERSRKSFALLSVDASALLPTDRRAAVLSHMLSALSSSLRETDIRGWRKNASVLGVILTETGTADGPMLRRTMPAKVRAALETQLEPRDIQEIQISLHIFPDDALPPHGGNGRGDGDGRGSGDGDGSGNDDGLHALYPDLHPDNDPKRTARRVKRAVDFVGSLTALILLSPLLLAIAGAIKLTSKGPVLFRQKRMGQYGKEFTFLKLRSMYSRNDPAIHRDYVRRFIAGKVDGAPGGDQGVYKLQRDRRVTPLGHLLRRTSLDELPQFLNVLRGEMSLVGPRPPIPYETEAYAIWHRRRFLEVKPGITGLWQVKGRSRLKFDEMVRLDIQYARTWSLGLDFKILLETPRAVLRGEGAY